MNPRERLKLQLMSERGYCHAAASGLARGACGGGLEMNEAIINRRRAVTGAQKAYLVDRRNCTLDCTAHHSQVGHTKDYRRWWLMEAGRIYGTAAVMAYEAGWPGRVKA